MLKNMLKDTPKLKIDFDTLPTYYVSIVKDELKIPKWNVNE